jgi:hypothetical protein
MFSPVSLTTGKQLYCERRTDLGYLRIPSDPECTIVRMKTTTKREQENKLRKMIKRNENSKILKSNKIRGRRRGRIR